MIPCRHIHPPLATGVWEEPLALTEGRAPCFGVIHQFGLLTMVAACFLVSMVFDATKED